MKTKKKNWGNDFTIFVGQAPSQRMFEVLFEEGGEGYAINICAENAVGGKLGEKLAEMGNFDSIHDYHRTNLNWTCRAKNGKGDAFDRGEGMERAAEILKSKFKHHVLLGKEVAACFGFRGAPLETHFDADLGKDFFLLPHPSGVNQWYNDPFNLFRAQKRLREYLGTDDESQS